MADPTFTARFIPTPTAFEGEFRIEGDALANAFSQALEPGHEAELALAFRLVWFWGTMTPAQRARAVADLYDLAEQREFSMAKVLNLKGSQEPEGAPR